MLVSPRVGTAPPHVEEALEVAVDVLDRRRAQPVEDPPHRHTVVGVRIAPRLGGDQEAAATLADLAHLRGVVPPIAQHEALVVIAVVGKVEPVVLGASQNTATQRQHPPLMQAQPF